jgi:hypothetical protein
MPHESELVTRVCGDKAEVFIVVGLIVGVN